ncbi:DUF4198 domain-containing protein [Acetobacter sp.]|jgi:hypothetical protein|uniref:DUF4198 domain-containing protein n=1 Tax=Acetobacter sp. TaxID=440 RepID=UPI0025C071BB|nr:DUF4198 domain-containing protein [Acetobacter sp.]MCH4091714.1 DUF4198 domain-containing protein [Acetobacter sp.]MCI1300429.1 DUF4198 domain-containing protein [Acetobacter sp.]MCI1316752.1 DUF4198 domain-containing protein [Acetobacter sp.]
MRKNILKYLLVFLFSPIGDASASSAFIVQQRIGKPTIVMEEVSSDEAYNPAYLRNIEAYDAHDLPLSIKYHSDGEHIILEADPRITAIIIKADFDFHARKSGQKEWIWARKSTVAHAETGLHAFKESVNLYAGSIKNQHSHNLMLEIVPETDPFALHRGDSLGVTVLLHGKPLKDVRLNENFLNTVSEKSPPTDAEGRTRVRLHADQMNVIQLTYEEPVRGDPDVDFFRLNSALTFNLGEKKQ